ncbi:hypothetical protein [Streptomyces sp. Root369]|uniref:hypothetical protein n=1 Tax=Streptomyces sp. Root369 TaxID=1736523 RepID=UPI00070F6CD5|nr:hypothetical protein [Streptomyces sp. Root369]KQW13552.1 hypothetical protein ASD08_30780 [Streptomyces sp. Root369]
MFRETVTHAGGDSRGTASESHALMLLRRALNRGFGMEATLTGGASIRWTRVDLGTHTIVLRSIALDPELPADAIDEATRALLALINAGDAQYAVRADRRVIIAGDTEISPLDSARLRARRLVAVDRAGRVRLTLAARLSLLALDHVQSGGGTDGFAMCSCGYTASAPTGETADGVLRNHRQTVTARFVQEIDASYAAAVSDSR